MKILSFRKAGFFQHYELWKSTDSELIIEYVAGVSTAFIYAWLGMLMKYVLCVFEHVYVGVGHVRGACAGG